jgi:hypothetical protein
MGTSSEAKIGAALPKTSHGNGLHAIAGSLVTDPEQVRYAIVRLDTGKVETSYEIDEEGERYEVTVPSARIRAIEPLAGQAAAEAARLMDAARAERLGELPFHAIARRPGDSLSGA